MLSLSACRNLGVCFLLNLVENLYNVPQSGGSYFGLLTPEPTLSWHQEALFEQIIPLLVPLPWLLALP